MGDQLLIDSYLTEYDNNISAKMNLDPLGTLGIWSYFGQEIFENKISSVSNDVRNYTLNLFHHVVIRDIVNHYRTEWSSEFTSAYNADDYRGFKQACLIHFENLFVYAISKAAKNDDVIEQGVLGRLAWEKIKRENVIFSADETSHVLTRQNTLGVSGRYKTPLIQIGFFNALYQYSDNTDKWALAEKLVKGNNELQLLKNLLIGHMRQVWEGNAQKPTISLDSISLELRKAYVKAFSSPMHVGDYTGNFWLDISGLNQGSSSALLEVIKSEDGLKQLSTKDAFHKAKHTDAYLELDPSEQKKIENIFFVEPLLADTDLLFKIMISKASQSIDEVIQCWQETYDRNESTIPTKADDSKGEVSSIGGINKGRLTQLQNLEGKPTLKEQIDFLLNYHQKVMDGRQQSPWVQKDKNGLLKARVVRKAPKTREPNDWYNSYYIPEFQNLVLGLKEPSV